MARIERRLRVAALSVAGGYVALYFGVAALRVTYPFELEWLEGTMVDHVRTILGGRPLYERPSLTFIPLTYTPGYFYLSAGLATLVGEGFLPMRLVSIVASLGLLATLFSLASRESGQAAGGLLAVGLFAAMYGWTDGWLDLARNDSLFLFLACLGIYVLRTRPTPAAAAAAGVLLALAFLVKQTALIVAIPLAMYCAWRGGRVLAAYAGTVAAIVGGGSILLDRAFDGWYSYYVFAVPRQHPLALEMLWGFWRFDLFRPLPIALAGAAGYLVWVLRERRWEDALFYFAAGAGLFGGALASRLHSLSYVNVVLPAYAAVSVLWAIAACECWRVARPGKWVPSIRLAATVLVSLQLVRLVYAPTRLVPTAEDVRAGEALVERVAGMPGEVFLPYHGYLPALAGKTTHAHAVVIADVIRGGASDADRALVLELEDALRSDRFASIVSTAAPTPVRSWLPIDRYYRPVETIVDRRSHFWREEIRYIRREPQERH